LLSYKVLTAETISRRDYGGTGVVVTWQPRPYRTNVKAHGQKAARDG